MKKQLPSCYNTVLMIVSAFSLCCFLSSCPPKKVAIDPKEAEVVPPEVELFEVEILVTQTSSYCGGAAPPQHLLDELANPKSVPISYFIRKGSVNVVTDKCAAFSTNDIDGVIHEMLPAGEYCLVFSNKVDRSYYKSVYDSLKDGNATNTAVDKDCLDKWLSTPELVFTVGKDSPKSYALNVHQPCSWDATPCTQYTGPLPP